MYDFSKEDRREFLSKDLVLSKVTPYQIFAYYVEDFKLGKIIRSPLREDKNPSWRVFASKIDGSLCYYDYSTKEYGDCFSFVMRMFGLNFYQAIERIAFDMNIVHFKPRFVSNKRVVGSIVPDVKIIRKPKKIIGVNKIDFVDSDFYYWSKYGINYKLLKKYNVIKCSKVFVNEHVLWVSNDLNPIYAYVFYKDGNYTFKIYRPKANKDEKWLSNTNRTILQGWDQLPDFSETLIITKSLKDVMVLNSIGYPSLAMQNEVSSIKDTVVDELYSRFKKIFILQDFDYAGVSGVNRLRKAYGFKYFFIQDFSTRSNGLKDISDFREVNNNYNTKQLIDSYTK